MKRSVRSVIYPRALSRPEQRQPQSTQEKRKAGARSDDALRRQAMTRRQPT
jgi:hypothetical protein